MKNEENLVILSFDTGSLTDEMFPSGFGVSEKCPLS